MSSPARHPMDRWDFDHIDHRDPRQAPLHWAGGKWFIVKDYRFFNDSVLAMKSFIAGGIAGAVSKTSVAPAERLKILMQTESLHWERIHLYYKSQNVYGRKKVFSPFGEVTLLPL
jgi:hypothetical protein